jgi:colanic acid/amylovoran biosynthesis glycosyltransferase
MNRPLSIAVFLGAFPVVSETFILRQITGLLDCGHDVDLYADTPGDPGMPVQPDIHRYRLLDRTLYLDAPAAVCPWEMPVWPPTGRTWLPGATSSIPNIRRLLDSLPRLTRAFLRSPPLAASVLSRAEYGFQAASLSALHRLARLSGVKKRYDILHAHFGPVGNSYRFATRLWRAPLVVSFHGYDVSSTPRQSGPRVYARLFADAAAVTANSNFMGDRLAALGCPPAKIVKLPYGLDLARFAVANRQRRAGDPVQLLTVGRLVEKKGIVHSIRAVASARAVHPGVRYDIVGEGPLRAKLQALITDLGQQDAITLLGARDADTLRTMLARAHIFVLASVTGADGDEEGTPVSLLEAQASGVPVLATRHAGIPEIVRDGETGFLVAEGDPEALACRLIRLIENPSLCVEMGRQGASFARAFDTRNTMRRLLALYDQWTAR